MPKAGIVRISAGRRWVTEYVQHRFNLGRGEANAQRIMVRLRSCGSTLRPRTNRVPIGPDHDGMNKPFGLQSRLQRGNPRYRLPRKPRDNSEPYARYFHRVQAHFPFIVFVPETRRVRNWGRSSNVERIEGPRSHNRLRNRRSRQPSRCGDLPRKRIGRQHGNALHEALDAYAEHIRQSKIETDEEQASRR